MLQQRHFETLRRPWAVWLALCMAMLMALAPTLSHALNAARGQGGQMIEVCTSNGPRWMALGQVIPEPTDATSAPASPPVLDHCPFCLLSAERALPPPDNWAHHFIAPGDHEVPTLAQAFFFVNHFSPLPPPSDPPDFF
jgi:hypothetical protein